MTQVLQSPRDLSPMWLDLAHVIAGAPTRMIVHPPQGAHVAPLVPVARRARRRSDVAGALPTAPSVAPAAAPHTARLQLSWPVLLLAQASGAALTAALLLLMGLGPV